MVFEAKNKLDDCNYAVKRIPLPKKIESRDRVMREVKTLANCEHKNIVRYFQAWIEQPPPGWQEEKDKELLAKDFLSTSITIETPSPTETESKAFLDSASNAFDIQKGRKEKQDLLKNVLKKNGQPDFIKNLNQFEPSFDASLEESSSYIQFKAHSTREDESDDGIVFQHPTTDETEDSFQIEFKNSINEDLITISIEKETEEREMEKSSSPENGRRAHKKQLSLDLSSCGDFKKNVQQNVANSKLRVYLFIQMQLCQKECLKDWLRTNNLEARNNKPIDIFDQIVSAVHYVHMKGLIHRDLKPSNIFFSLDGQIKIGDFGLVTDMADISDDSGSSSSSILGSESAGDCFHKKHTHGLGTHLYMSPEQLQHLQYNYKVDIYSLGLILFELLVFFGTETERIMVLTGLKNHKFPEDFQRKFNDEFEVLKLMLSKSPDSRPTTFGLMCRPPLNQLESAKSFMEQTDHQQYHFELPPRRRDSHRSFTNLNRKISE